MNIKDIIKESRDLDDFGFGYHQSNEDARFNPEAVKFAQENEKYYDEICAEDGSTQVFTRIEEDPYYNRPFDNQPEKGTEQSAGYRGREKAKQRSGIPHSPYNKQRDNFVDPFPSRDLSNPI